MKLLENFRYFLFRRNLRRQAVRHVRFPDWNKVQNVLIIYESDYTEDNALIKEIVRTMWQENRNVVTWGFVNKKNITSPILPQSRILGARDLTFWGDLTEEAKQDLTRQAYDVLIDLTQQPCLPLHYSTLYANSRFKVGRHIEDGLHDLLIEMEPNESIEPLYKQIIHYLGTIQSND